MNILAMAREDAKSILNEGGFEVDITLEAPSSVTANVKGIVTTVNVPLDMDGQIVNGKLAHVSIIEKDLLDLNYPALNEKGKVYLKGHKVSYPDSNGTIITYKVDEVLSDRQLGITSLVLGEYEPSAGYNPITDDDLVMFYDFSGLSINTDNSFGTVDASGLISNWKNIKANSDYDLMQNVTTSMPMLQNDYIETDGVNDFLESLDIPTEIKNKNDFTFIVIGERSANIEVQVAFQSLNQNYIFNGIDTANKSFLQSKDSAVIGLSLSENTLIPNGSKYVNWLNFKTDWTIVSNGNSDLSGDLTNTKNPTIGKLKIASIISVIDYYYTLKLKGVMIFNKEVTDAQKIIDINEYITNKWL